MPITVFDWEDVPDIALMHLGISAAEDSEAPPLICELLHALASRVHRLRAHVANLEAGSMEQTRLVHVQAYGTQGIEPLRGECSQSESCIGSSGDSMCVYYAGSYDTAHVVCRFKGE